MSMNEVFSFNEMLDYRAWHYEEKKMCRVTNINFNKGAFLLGVKPEEDRASITGRLIIESPKDGRFCYFDEIKIMQYSGLKDKNNTKIYVGDIVQLKNAEGRIIKAVCEFGIARRFLSVGGETNECDIPSFYFKVDDRKTFPIVNNYQGKHDLELFEIVGNIYEN